MQAIFYAISIFGILYFLLAKRVFDWFAVAFLSACIYFLPGFFGYTSYLTLTSWSETPINAEAYLIMVTVELAIILGALIRDVCGVQRTAGSAERNCSVLYMMFLLAATGLLLMLVTTGKALFYSDKLELLHELNRFHILFYTATMIGCTMAFEFRKWYLFAMFCMFILFDIFIGFRTTFAITFISVFTLWLSGKGKKRILLNYWKQGLVGVVMAIFLFFYKQVGYAVKVGDIDLLISLIRGTSDSFIFSAMFTNSEPFISQTILNVVTQNHYSVGLDHLKGLLHQFILFAPQLGIDAVSFNDLFQKDLFPEVDYGMANNIWAEMWSAGGWPLLLLFILLFVIIVSVATQYANVRHPSLRAVFAVMSSYWVFYIHRNDIAYEVNLEKRVLLVTGIAFALAFLVRWVTTVRTISPATYQDSTLEI